MKKKIVGLLFIATLVIGGCGSQKEENKEEKPPIVQEEQSKQEEEQKKEPEEEELENNNAEHSQEENEPGNTQDVEPKTVLMYYLDMNTAEITSKNIEITGDVSTGIIDGLKQAELLRDGCAVQKVEVNETEQSMVIDINQAFGDYIRSMGTTGSEQIIECTARTYMNAYGCKKIKITEQGKALDTGHAELGTYISYNN